MNWKHAHILVSYENTHADLSYRLNSSTWGLVVYNPVCTNNSVLSTLAAYRIGPTKAVKLLELHTSFTYENFRACSAEGKDKYLVLINWKFYIRSDSQGRTLTLVVTEMWRLSMSTEAASDRCMVRPFKMVVPLLSVQSLPQPVPASPRDPSSRSTPEPQP